MCGENGWIYNEFFHIFCTFSIGELIINSFSHYTDKWLMRFDNNNISYRVTHTHPHQNRQSDSDRADKQAKQRLYIPFHKTNKMRRWWWKLKLVLQNFHGIIYVQYNVKQSNTYVYAYANMFIKNLEGAIQHYFIHTKTHYFSFVTKYWFQIKIKMTLLRGKVIQNGILLS